MYIWLFYIQPNFKERLLHYRQFLRFYKTVHRAIYFKVAVSRDVLAILFMNRTPPHPAPDKQAKMVLLNDSFRRDTWIVFYKLAL